MAVQRARLNDFPGEVLTVQETARVLGVGQDNVYTLVRTNQLRVLRIGNRILVPKQVLRRMLLLPLRETDAAPARKPHGRARAGRQTQVSSTTTNTKRAA